MSSVQLSLSRSGGNSLALNEKTITQALNSYLCSTKYLGHVVPLTMFYIVYNRIEYDPSNYVKTNIKDWHYIILNKNTEHEQLIDLYTWSHAAMKALRRGCLSHLFMKILNNNETVEYYRYSFDYFKSSTESKPKGTNNEIIKLTRDWFKNFSILNELAKVPSTATLSVEVILTEKPDSLTLQYYKETDKIDIYDAENDNDKVQNLMQLSVTCTNYHKVRTYCKIKAIDASVQDYPLDLSDAAEVHLVEDSPTIAKSAITSKYVLSSNDEQSVTGYAAIPLVEDVNNEPIKPKSKDVDKNKNIRGRDNLKKQVVVRKSPKCSTEKITTEMIAQKIISYKDKVTEKGKDIVTTIYGGTTVEVVEPENYIPTSTSPLVPNSVTTQVNTGNNLKRKHTIKGDDRNQTLAKKSNTHAKFNKKDSQCEGKTDPKKGRLNFIKDIPKLMSGKDEGVTQGNKVTIIKDITIEPAKIGLKTPEKSVRPNLAALSKIDDNHDSQHTPPSELFINNELFPKAKRNKRINFTKRVARKSKRNSKAVLKAAQNDIQGRSAKIRSNKMTSKQLQVNTSVLTQLPPLESKEINDSLFNDTTINLDEIEGRHTNLSASVEVIENEGMKGYSKTPGLYINKIQSLTPKKPALKRLLTGKVERDLNMAKTKPKEACQKENSKELASPTLPRHGSTQSFDSLSLGEASKTKQSTTRQPLVDSTQLGGYSKSQENSSDLFENSAELGDRKTNRRKELDAIQQGDDAHSVSSTDNDMYYINNRIAF